MSEDPIGFKGGDTNLYRIVVNNSLIFTDPFGFALFYFGGSGMGGGGFGGGAGIFGGISGGIYMGDTRCAGSSSTGNYGSLGVGSATGLFGGAGIVFGINGGSVEDFAGSGGQSGFTVGPITGAINWASDGEFLGIEMGIGAGWGFGAFDSSTHTGVIGGSGTRRGGSSNACGCP